jgi:hypothetical protein
MVNPYETLTFNMSNEELAAAVEELRTLQPTILYPEAWRILDAEQDRRKATGHPVPINLARGAYEAMPPSIKARLGPPSKLGPP